MSDPRHDYIEALTELSAADKKLDGYVTELEAIVKGLQEARDTFQFHNLSSGHGVLTGHWNKNSQNARQFPPDTIQDTLNDRLRIKNLAKKAWEAIPEDQRGLLPPLG